VSKDWLMCARERFDQRKQLRSQLQANPGIRTTKGLVLWRELVRQFREDLDRYERIFPSGYPQIEMTESSTEYGFILTRSAHPRFKIAVELQGAFIKVEADSDVGFHSSVHKHFQMFEIKLEPTSLEPMLYREGIEIRDLSDVTEVVLGHQIEALIDS
jgi:hypothetical protein